MPICSASSSAAALASRATYTMSRSSETPPTDDGRRNPLHWQKGDVHERRCKRSTRPQLTVLSWLPREVRLRSLASLSELLGLTASATLSSQSPQSSPCSAAASGSAGMAATSTCCTSAARLWSSAQSAFGPQAYAAAQAACARLGASMNTWEESLHHWTCQMLVAWMKQQQCCLMAAQYRCAGSEAQTCTANIARTGAGAPEVAALPAA